VNCGRGRFALKENEAMSLLDAAMPEWHWCETYGMWLPVSPAAALELMKSIPPNEVRLLRTLIEMRSLPGRLVGRPRFGKGISRSNPLFEQILNFGFCSLGEEESEVAFGLIDQSWKVSGGRRAPVNSAIEFTEFSQPGFVKIGANLLARPSRHGAFVSTQTRVLATDPRTRRVFGAYWLFIRPFSGLIRRSWLQAAARRTSRANSS
jgi:hypothetical protein